MPDLVLPDMIERRVYYYKYDIANNNLNIADIELKCRNMSGKYDVSIYSDVKGQKLTEKIREVEVTYDGSGFLFSGNSFMPKQVRIMTGMLVFGKMKVMPPTPLSLYKVILSDEANKNIFVNIEVPKQLADYGVLSAEKVDDITVAYISKENKGEIIGNNGTVIRRLRKEIGKLVIKEID